MADDIWKKAEIIQLTTIREITHVISGIQNCGFLIIRFIHLTYLFVVYLLSI